MDLFNETILLKTKFTLFNLLIRETSQFLCFERLLNLTYVAHKNAFFREMQIWSYCYTVVSFRLSVYKIQAVYLSGAKIARYPTLVPRLLGNSSIVNNTACHKKKKKKKKKKKIKNKKRYMITLLFNGCVQYRRQYIWYN